MNSLNFSLQQFPSASFLPDLEITGTIARFFNTLSICYVLHGPLAEIVIPASADIPARQNGLWGDTCFEFFLNVKNSDPYWEFNLSPAGHWNVYRFKTYRQGMQEELAFASLPVSIQRQSDILNLSLELDLGKIIPADQTLNVAISAVIKSKNGTVIYWALCHHGPQADFHRRDSFIVEL
jgi:hypothetical protein